MCQCTDPQSGKPVELTAPEAGRKSAAVRLAHRLGRLPLFYSALRTAMGGHDYWPYLLREVGQVKPGMRILDIGCGPASVVRHLPPLVEYVGIDHNPCYLRHARDRFGHRATFVHADATAVGDLSGEFDIVLAMGILHHLDDRKVSEMLKGVARIMGPRGKLVTADVVDLPQASPSARWLLRRDRGNHVRADHGYLRLIEGSFAVVESAVVSDLLHVPITGAGFPLMIGTASVPQRAVLATHGAVESGELAAVPVPIG